MQYSNASLDCIISPKSVAVLGASNREGSVGNAVIKNIILGGYEGRIYPVNPSSSQVSGLACYSSLLDIKDQIDLAVVITPSHTVPDVIDECGKKGVKGSLVISAGFREIGGEGAMLEQKLVQAARKYNVRVIGPNCVGFINTSKSISLNAAFTKGMPRPGNIALVSQSGAICGAILEYAKARNIGFSKVFSLGNKVDVNENHVLEYLAGDTCSKVILMYIEDLTEGGKFLEIASNVTRSGKPIIALKVGQSSIGAKAIASHTGALAGSEEAYNAVFEQAGILRVETLEELFDYAIAFAYQNPPVGDAVIVSNAGGPAVIAADAAARYHLKLCTLDENITDNLRKVLPKNAVIINPVDIIGDASHERYESALRTVLKGQGVGSCIVVSTPQMMLDVEALARVIVNISREFPNKTILSCIIGIVGIENVLKILEENSIPQYVFPESAVRALAAMYKYAALVKKEKEIVPVFDADREAVRKVLAGVRNEGRNYVYESEAMAILSAYGIPVPHSAMATTEQECLRISRQIGYPVVLKITSPDIVHKVDVGGVILGLKNENEAKEAYHHLIQNVLKAQPDARIAGVNVVEFIEHGKEVIIGMKRVPQFGSLIMFGSGGIYVHVFGDVSFKLAPLTRSTSYEMIASTKTSKLLEGVRGEKPSDIQGVVDCLQRMSQLAVEFPEILEIDVNPLMVYGEGKGCKAADARMVIS